MSNFTAHVADRFDCTHEEAAGFIELCDALRPHLAALNFVCRRRFADHLDRAARDVVDGTSLQCFVARGRAQECAEFPIALERNCELLAEMAKEFIEAQRASIEKTEE